jgi:hypothetical protein
LVDATGGPVAGATVALNENRGLANDIVGGIGALFSLGLSCLAGADPCRPSGSVPGTTDPAGRFSFGTDQVIKARARSNGVILTAGDDRRGTVTVRLNPGLGGALGDLALWDPHTGIGRERSMVAVRWQAPAGADRHTVLGGAVNDGSAPAAVLASFSAQGTSGSALVDPRSMEDHAGLLLLSAGFHRPRAAQNPRVDWTGPVQRLTGAGAPLSRHAPCHLEGRADPEACPLTDGDLVAPISSPNCAAATPPSCVTSAVVDLGQSVQDVIVAVRPAGTSTVEGSADGVAYGPLAAQTTAGKWNASLTSPRDPVRYLRVRPASSGPLAAAEVSVWPIAIKVPAASPVPSTGGSAASPPSATGPASHPARHRGLSVLALGLVALVALAAGVLLGRRTRPRRR